MHTKRQEKRFEVCALQIKPMGLGNIERETYVDISEDQVDGIIKEHSWFAPNAIILIDFEQEKIQLIFGNWESLLDCCLKNRGLTHFKKIKH